MADPPSSRKTGLRRTRRGGIGDPMDRCFAPALRASLLPSVVEPKVLIPPGTVTRRIFEGLILLRVAIFVFENGGEGGIRTPDRFNPIPAFQASAFDHSATSPGCSTRPLETA